MRLSIFVQCIFQLLHFNTSYLLPKNFQIVFIIYILRLLCKLVYVT